MVSGILTGLKSIQQYDDDVQAAKEAASRPKVTWFGVQPDTKANFQPLQELDPDSPNYSEKNGLGFLAVEHTPPGAEGYRRKALCTAEDEGRCVGCEQHKYLNKIQDPDYKGEWKQKVSLYLNGLVTDAVDDKGNKLDPFVAVLNRSRGPKSTIAPVIVDWAVDEGSITDTVFTIKSTKTGNQPRDISYSTTPKPAKKKINPEDYELFDLADAVRSVPYEEQAAYYGLVSADSDSADEPAAKSADTDTDEWA